MSEVSNSQKLTNIVVLSHVKRKIKAYYNDKNVTKINLSMFPQYLVHSLIAVLEELLTDSLVHVTKNDVNGLYVIDKLILTNILNSSTKFNFFNKYVKQYGEMSYEDSLFFNLTKVLSKLESKHGDKLMINPEAKRFIGFLLVSLQYDICNLAQKILKSNDRVTMSKNIILITNEYIIGEDINNKIKLKLDCISDTKASDDAEENNEADANNEDSSDDDSSDDESSG